MECLVSLEGYDPELRDYLQHHRWPNIMEALLTGLTVMTPRDPWQFVIQSLAHIRDTDNTDIPRDIFVDLASQPLLQRNPLRSLLTDSDHIDEDQLEAAYQFRGRQLYRWSFNAWLQFHAQEREELVLYRKRLEQAKSHYSSHIRSTLLHAWRDYTRKKTFHRRRAYDILTHMHQKRLMGILLDAWLKDAIEMKQTRVFFDQRREREAEGKEWTWAEGEDPISLMDRSVTLKIFSRVGVRSLVLSGRVCHSWKSITEDPGLWNRLDFAPFGRSLQDSSLARQLHTHRPVLGHLSLRGCSSLTPDSLRIIGECRNLQDLNLSECQITDDVMDAVARGCSGLVYLNISYCYVTDSIIRILASRCANLDYLSLAHCLHFTSKGLRAINRGKGCRRLVYLDLSGCTQLTAEGLQHVATACPILNTLLLDDMPNITDAMILKLVNSCHTLRHVSVLGGCRLSDHSLKYLALYNKKLRSIKIENDPALSDTSLRALSRGCRDLKLLFLAGCSRISDKGLLDLKKLKHLHVLNLSDCSRVSDLGVRHIVEGASSSQLQELNLTNCLKLSDISLFRLTSACLSLTHLSLSYCEHISDTGVELLGQLPRLCSLDLTGCSITDQGVASLNTHTDQTLHHLGLAELGELTDDGLQHMCPAMSLLQTLDLSDCEQLTSNGLQTIAFHCHLLRQLYLANCHRMTDEGIKYLSKGCSYLTHLDLSGCVITDKSLRKLRHGCPHLHSLNILCCVNVSRDEVQRYRQQGLEISYNTDRPKYLNQTIPGLTDLETEQLIDRL